MNKILNISVCVIIVESVLKINGKYYPKIYLDSCYFKDNSDNDYCGYLLKLVNNSKFGESMLRKLLNFSDSETVLLMLLTVICISGD